jgi:hypothetical protein
MCWALNHQNTLEIAHGHISFQVHPRTLGPQLNRCALLGRLHASKAHCLLSTSASVDRHDNAMAKSFIIALKGPILTWYTRLLSMSIDS